VVAFGNEYPRRCEIMKVRERMSMRALKFDECSIREVFRNHMPRHVPQHSPLSSRASRRGHSPPLAFAGGPPVVSFPHRLIVGYDELDVPANPPAGSASRCVRGGCDGAQTVTICA